MPNSDRRHSYSKVLSAGIFFCFNLLAGGQNAPPAAAPPVPPGPQTTPAAKPEDALTLQQRSIALQRESIERQRAAAGGQSSNPPTARFAAWRDAAGNRTASFNCAPVAPILLASAVQRAAAAHRVAPNLIDAVIRQESAGYPCAVSDKGALGLMQLMPATAAEMGVSDPFDVNQNIAAGARLLASLMERYKGDLNRVLGAYNAGPAAVDRAGGPPPFPETLSYIRSILSQINTVPQPKLIGGDGR